jgi:hypothetical protein
MLQTFHIRHVLFFFVRFPTEAGFVSSHAMWTALEMSNGQVSYRKPTSAAEVEPANQMGGRPMQTHLRAAQWQTSRGAPHAVVTLLPSGSFRLSPRA